MDKVENDVFVSVEYKGTLKNGDVFDTSHGRQPLEVKMGAGSLIEGFESELMGMSVNEKKTFTLEPERAYGLRDENCIHTFARKEIPSEMNPEVGQMICLSSPEGKEIPARISKVDDKEIIVDLNHPLAGEELTFEIEVTGISDTPTQPAHGCGDCSCDANDASEEHSDSECAHTDGCGGCC